MTINDKIKQILIDKNLSPSYFADEIGVQRSSISHILSGRNRPSFDIIQKIIRRFPELGYEWIMEEDNQPVNSTIYSNRGYTRPATERTERISNGQGPGAYAPQQTGIRNQRNELPPLTAPMTPALDDHTYTEPTQAQSLDRKVERILIFYTDGSFREYMPSA